MAFRDRSAVASQLLFGGHGAQGKIEFTHQRGNRRATLRVVVDRTVVGTRVGTIHNARSDPRLRAIVRTGKRNLGVQLRLGTRDGILIHLRRALVGYDEILSVPLHRTRKTNGVAGRDLLHGLGALRNLVELELEVSGKPVEEEISLIVVAVEILAL